MTGTRVLTALVLMPLAIVIVLFGSTALVAVAVAVLTILALWEYFALGDAIGHRAYRLWIVTCALLLIFLQWKEAYGVGTSSSAFPLTSFVVVTFDISIYVLGVAVLTLFNRRPLVESLPAAGISSSALLLVAVPLSFAVPLHSSPFEGHRLLLFALAITWAGDTVASSLAVPSANILSRPKSPPNKPGKARSAASSDRSSPLTPSIFGFPSLSPISSLWHSSETLPAKSATCWSRPASVPLASRIPAASSLGTVASSTASMPSSCASPSSGIIWFW